MKFHNYKPIRLIELFAGIGSQAKALKNLGIDFEHWNVCEFDPHVIRSYNAVHDTNFAISDITKINATDLNIIDTDRFTYLLTYSFPCQDLSQIGTGAGMEKGSGTRSGLLWEVERLLNECDELPQVLLMENVPQVHGKKNIEHFNKWIEFLESKGYSNHWKDLNSKGYGVPQNRNRCFMVSILGDYSFVFPDAFPLNTTIGDMLEETVDDKFYLSDKMIDYLFTTTEKNKARKNGNIFTPTNIDGVAKTITTKEGQRIKDNFIVFESRKDEGMRFFQDNICGSLRTIDSCGDKRCIDLTTKRIRKLTPKECWRLMGFTDIDFEKAEKVCSNTQLYKQAGNSIVVNVLMAIFKELFITDLNRSDWLDDLLRG